MRLGVRSRLAIVASVVWIIAAPLYLTNRELTDWETRTTSLHELCLKLANNMPDGKATTDFYERCNADARSSSDAMIAARWSLFEGSVGLSAFGLLIAWVLAGIIYATGRWILAGRKNIR